MDATKILTAEEIRTVLLYLHFRMLNSPNCRRNLIIFRLSCCCGLRCKEIRGLDLGDLVINSARPCIQIRKEITKGQEGKRRPRKVPLWWDKGTLKDLTAWRLERLSARHSLDSPVVVGEHGKRLTVTSIARRWKTALRILGPDRVDQLSIHCGRHSFVSHALNAGRSLVEVRDAAGHASVDMTSKYAHLLERDNVPDVFGE